MRIEYTFFFIVLSFFIIYQETVPKLENWRIFRFFQVVWRASTQLGCGISKYTWVNQGTTYYVTVIVARYTPAGNSYTTGQQQAAYNTNVKQLETGGTVKGFVFSLIVVSRFNSTVGDLM